MDSLEDLLRAKANTLDIGAKRTALQLAQAELDRVFSGQARLELVRRDGTAVVLVPNASVATIVRYKQTQVLPGLRNIYSSGKGIIRLQIVISEKFSTKTN